MRLPPSFIEELKHRMPIESVISPYTELKRAGRNLKALCPFHSEKTPSFVVYDDNQSYYCFGCNSGGDAITFIMEVEHLDYMEAVKYLAEKAGLTMPSDTYDDTTERLRIRVLELNREAGRYFNTMLNSPAGKPGMDYLVARGMSPGLIRKFGLGYAPDSWGDVMDHLKKAGFSEAEMVAAGIAKRSQKGTVYCYFRGRVMFPIIDVRGNVIAFGGRILTNEKPKYLNSPDSLVYKKTRQVFALNFAKNTKSGTIILTEGYMDAISLYKAGLDNGVATCGTALTDDQARMIAKYCQQAVIAYDSDEAGQRATARAMTILDKTGVSVKVLSIEGAKDPDEYLKNFGAERLKKSVETSANAYAFRLDMAKKKSNLLTDEGKVAYLKDAVDILAEITFAAERDVFIGRIVKELELTRGAIEESIKQVRKRKYSQSKNKDKNRLTDSADPLEKANPQRRGNLRASRAEDLLIACLIMHPDKLETVKALLGEAGLITDMGNRLMGEIGAQIEAGGTFEMSMLSDDFTTKEMSYVAGILARHHDIVITDDDLADCGKVIVAQHQKMTNSQAGELPDNQYEEYLSHLMENKR